VLAHAKRFAPDWNPPLTAERIDLFIADRQIDISRARHELHYQPVRTNLEEMLAETYRFYKQRGLV
jgi:nucleoside-diphosphate-sugar epimerase